MANRLAEARSHVGGGGARGQPAWFEHDQLLSGQPGFVEQGDGNVGGLSSTRLCSQEHRSAGGQPLAERGNRLFYW